MKTIGMLTLLAAVIILTAATAFARDFDSVLDADYIGYPDGPAEVAHYNPADFGPGSDAEWDGAVADTGTVLALRPATFDAFADADILAGESADAGAATADYACASTCAMACGDACASHCPPACASR